MELDREMQRRVWERVQRREPEQMLPLKRENVKPLLYPAQENSAAYQSLSRRMPGKDAEKCRRLHQETQKCIACMKGMCRLRGEQVKLQPLPAPKEPTSYGRNARPAPPTRITGWSSAAWPSRPGSIA